MVAFSISRCKVCTDKFRVGDCMIASDQRLQNELSPNEKLLWEGQPQQGLVFRAVDVFLIPFSLVWTSGPVSIMISILFKDGVSDLSGAVLLFMTIPILFFFVGLYMLIGRFIHDRYRRKNTVYGLTDKRAILIDRRSIRFVDLAGAGAELNFKLYPKDRGTIEFGKTRLPALHSFSDSFKYCTGQPMGKAFERVSNASDVYRQVKAVMGF